MRWSIGANKLLWITADEAQCTSIHRPHDQTDGVKSR